MRTLKTLAKKKLIRRSITDASLIFLGVLIAGLGLKGFLLPNNFIDGGVTGISLLIGELTTVPVSLLIFLINIPFIVIGLKQVSRSFAIKTLLAIAGLALCLIFIDYPVVTHEKLLVSVFGGLFLGAGIGLAIRGGGVIDGTEILAVYLNRLTSLTLGNIILIINLIIFGFAAILLGIEVALYSILTYMSATKAVDFIILGIEEYTGVSIISEESEAIRNLILEKFNRGVTIYKGERGLGKKGEMDLDIVFTVVTKLELQKLMNEIDKIDACAFVFQYSINDIKGGMIKKRPLHI